MIKKYFIKKIIKSRRKSRKPSLKKSRRKSRKPSLYAEDGCCNKKPAKKYKSRCKLQKRSRSRSRSSLDKLLHNKSLLKKIIKSIRKSRKNINNGKMSSSKPYKKNIDIIDINSDKYGYDNSKRKSDKYAYNKIIEKYSPNKPLQITNV